MNELTKQVIEWTRNHVNSIGEDFKVVVGISGGVDSSVTAAVLKEAIGPDRVIGIMMPCGTQVDIEDSRKIIKHLGIESYEINIGDAYTGLTIHMRAIAKNGESFPPDTYTTNTPARLRMTTLYGVAAVVGKCLVVNTCNLSEDVVGYSTKFGDHAGDFSIINKLTKTEVRGIGADLGLPDYLVNKTPTDGMSLNADGSLKSDEDKLGISYEDLDRLIRTGVSSAEVLEKVENLYHRNLHKFDLNMPHFTPELFNYFNC